MEITDVLNENVLRYRLKGGASYIRDKNIKTFYPSSVSTYSSNSNSVIRFNLTGGANEWINLRSLLIGFTLINADNDGTKELRPAYKSSSFFQRMRVMAGSNVIAEIPDLNRYEAMMDILQDDGSRNYTDNLGFGETFNNEGNRFLTNIRSWKRTQFQTQFRMSLTKRNLTISEGLKTKDRLLPTFLSLLQCIKLHSFIILSDCH